MPFSILHSPKTYLPIVVYSIELGRSRKIMKFVPLSIDHGKKDGGCTFYQNALWSEVVQKSRLTSFEEQTEDIKLFSH
jgi:hypothetical protein